MTIKNLKTGSREDLLGLCKRRFRFVAFPEFGLQFRIRSLSELERTEFETATLQATGDFNLDRVRNAKRHLVCLCVVDTDGRPMFDFPEDLPALEPLDGLVTGRLYNECRKFVGLDKSDIEELVGNSAAIAAAGSLTD